MWGSNPSAFEQVPGPNLEKKASITGEKPNTHLCDRVEMAASKLKVLADQQFAPIKPKKREVKSPNSLVEGVVTKMGLRVEDCLPKQRNVKSPNQLVENVVMKMGLNVEECLSSLGKRTHAAAQPAKGELTNKSKKGKASEKAPRARKPRAARAPQAPGAPKVSRAPNAESSQMESVTPPRNDSAASGAQTEFDWQSSRDWLEQLLTWPSVEEPSLSAQQVFASDLSDLI
ncbi:MAG: hypothetical protein S4CHLAM102_15030 [Chlamydiia bacterium]|nr:hypothetical protein [Chlamydiia bacterium]